MRWFHWINFPVLALMIWSGLMIYWANGVYKIGFGDTTLLRFFPNGFYETLHPSYRLGEGMSCVPMSHHVMPSPRNIVASTAVTTGFIEMITAPSTAGAPCSSAR